MPEPTDHAIYLAVKELHNHASVLSEQLGMQGDDAEAQAMSLLTSALAYGISTMAKVAAPDRQPTALAMAFLIVDRQVRRAVTAMMQVAS